MNHTYYQGPTGHQVMSAENYCSDIVGYLENEREVLMNLLGSGLYRAVIELGCDRLRLMSVAIATGVDYLGVDARADLRSINKDDCKRERAIRSRFLHAKIESLVSRMKSKQKVSPNSLEGTLAILPFNFAGNIKNPVETCLTLMLHGADVLLSSFNPTHRSKEVRSSYYEKCMVNASFIDLPEYGHIFFDAGHPFLSVSISPEVVEKMFDSNLFRVEIICMNDISYIAKIQRRSS